MLDTATTGATAIKAGTRTGEASASSQGDQSKNPMEMGEPLDLFQQSEQPVMRRIGARIRDCLERKSKDFMMAISCSRGKKTSLIFCKLLQ
jgi:hypothetical protein